MRNSLRPGMKSLSTSLQVLAILSALVAVFGFIVGLGDGDPFGLMVGIIGIGGVLACLLGRVLIYIAVTLDDIGMVLGAPSNAQLWPLRDQIADPATPPQ